MSHSNYDESLIVDMRRSGEHTIFARQEDLCQRAEQAIDKLNTDQSDLASERVSSRPNTSSLSKERPT